MLVTMKEIMDRANAGGYAVAAPNAHWELEARAEIEAAEKMNAPIIIDVAFFCRPDMVFFGQYLTKLAEEASVPVAINLDHGGEFSHAVAAIRAGFTGVMVDRSSCPFEQNVKETAEIAKIAHSVGVSVEAELGHVGTNDTDGYDPTDKSLFTRPEEAKEFVERTGVDQLAVAIGTSHGLYKGVTPTLDFELLAEIKKTVGIPLVLHGGSGTAREDLRKACQMGINKVNIYSELSQTAYAKIDEVDRSKEPGFKMFDHIQDGYRERLCEMIEYLGSKDKSWCTKETGVTNKKIVF